MEEKASFLCKESSKPHTAITQNHTDRYYTKPNIFRSLIPNPKSQPKEVPQIGISNSAKPSFGSNAMARRD